MPKKIEKEDPLVSSGFVGYVKKVKNEKNASKASNVKCKTIQKHKNPPFHFLRPYETVKNSHF